MAEHAEPQYATADGNDLPAHEVGFSQFVEVVVVGTALVVNILIGLAIGGVIGNWLPGAFVIIAGVAAAAVSGWTGLRIVSFAMVAISALLLLLNAYG
jgi:integral membrane sensor domain MASE1